MEIEITIPENWNDVSLEQYIKYYKSIKAYEGTEDFSIKMVENAMYYLCGIEAEILNKLKIETYNQLISEMTALLNSVKDQKLILTFEIGDSKYGFTNNLDQMSYGEYIDLVTYSKDVYENAAVMCSILYRPITEEHKGKYTISEYKGTNQEQVELFSKKLTMDIVFGSLSFFLNLQKDLLSCTLTYTTEEMTNILKTPNSTAAQILAENGVSMEQLQLLQEMIRQSSTQSQD
jgi:hypothetical protein